MKKYFDFKDALDYMESGDIVGIVINGKERLYYFKDGEFWCIPNKNSNMKYKVNKFFTDSILSNNWYETN